MTHDTGRSCWSQERPAPSFDHRTLEPFMPETTDPQPETALVEGPQTVTHNANQPAAGHSPRATEAELYVLLRKSGEDRYEAQALIDRHRAEVLRRQQPVDRSAFLREVADICDEAGAVYTSKALNDHAGAAFALMERFLRKANEAEYVATPCSLPNVCEDGGEPCSTHERLMAHAEGDHELCGPDCGTSAVEAPAPNRAGGEEDGELVCVDECGSCDACGMEPFGSPAEGWREAARFLRRTPRDSVDFPGALRGARLIEDELRRKAETEPAAVSQPGAEA